jgi:hypothetical protein
MPFLQRLSHGLVCVPCATRPSHSRLPGTDVPGFLILPLRGWTLFRELIFCELFFYRACHAQPKH